MNKSSITRAAGGLFILTLGLIFLLNNLGVIDASELTSNWWPLLVIAAGLLILANNLRNWVGLFLIVLGGAYQFRELGIINFQPWEVIWPLAIVFIGASILFRRSYVGHRASKEERDDLTAILAGTNSVNASKKFKEAKVTAIMGGAQLDLRKATIEDGAIVEVFGFWGGVEIIVPKHVIIKNKVNNVMAGTDDRTSQEADKNAPVLTVAGDLIMAGITIRNTPSAS